MGKVGKDKIFGAGVVSICEKAENREKEKKKKAVQRTKKKETRLVDVDFVKEPLSCVSVSVSECECVCVSVCVFVSKDVLYLNERSKNTYV